LWRYQRKRSQGKSRRKYTHYPQWAGEEVGSETLQRALLPCPSGKDHQAKVEKEPHKEEEGSLYGSSAVGTG
jgi:hypothetical protein